jgi:hypothetical protein
MILKEGIQITPKNQIEYFDRLFCSSQQLVDGDRHDKYYLKDNLIVDDLDRFDRSIRCMIIGTNHHPDLTDRTYAESKIDIKR